MPFVLQMRGRVREGGRKGGRREEREPMRGFVIQPVMQVRPDEAAPEDRPQREKANDYPPAPAAHWPTTCATESSFPLLRDWACLAPGMCPGTRKQCQDGRWGGGDMRCGQEVTSCHFTPVSSLGSPCRAGCPQGTSPIGLE